MPDAAPHNTPETDPPIASWKRRIPNALVILRLALTVFVLVALARFDGTERTAILVVIATALFVFAALTDALDGWLARRWNAITLFGRVMDPLADKVLVLGTFIMLAGPNFVGNDPVDLADPTTRPHLSGVAPWMVVVMVTRELLVTSLRGMLEGRGIDFSAAGIGKAKMIAQSVGAPLIMLLVVLSTQVATKDPGDGITPTADYFVFSSLSMPIAAAIAWTITVITAVSAIPYCTRAINATKDIEA